MSAKTIIAVLIGMAIAAGGIFAGFYYVNRGQGDQGSQLATSVEPTTESDQPLSTQSDQPLSTQSGQPLSTESDQPLGTQSEQAAGPFEEISAVQEIKISPIEHVATVQTDFQPAVIQSEASESRLQSNEDSNPVSTEEEKAKDDETSTIVTALSAEESLPDNDPSSPPVDYFHVDDHIIALIEQIQSKPEIQQIKSTLKKWEQIAHDLLALIPDGDKLFQDPARLSALQVSQGITFGPELLLRITDLSQVFDFLIQTRHDTLSILELLRRAVKEDKHADLACELLKVEGIIRLITANHDMFVNFLFETELPNWNNDILRCMIKQDFFRKFVNSRNDQHGSLMEFAFKLKNAVMVDLLLDTGVWKKEAGDQPWLYDAEVINALRDLTDKCRLLLDLINLADAHNESCQSEAGPVTPETEDDQALALPDNAQV